MNWKEVHLKAGEQIGLVWYKAKVLPKCQLL